MSILSLKRTDSMTVFQRCCFSQTVMDVFAKFKSSQLNLEARTQSAWMKLIEEEISFEH